ncbi:hypothetical protein [Glycomyces buryatensis]|uniref:Uncharacterized protein n=1 Tax=Glycomyces buryatensis TaxID=2570927 RepID=A0A4S8QC85_9ACTN|nr:hypothetical protein [Glycomyces buryatensis]THV40572.1 hypothetical protein FAB82_15000 [Glycomyces buryatensis]
MTAEAAPWSPFEDVPADAESPTQSPAVPARDTEPAPCTLQRHLHVVPESNAGQAGDATGETLHSAPDPAPASADSAAAPPVPELAETSEAAAAEEAPVEVAATGPSMADRLAGVRAIWVPPNWRTERPASLDEVIAYADTAPWCAGDGKARKAGRAYNRLVAVPVSALAYVIAWIFQRPGRAATVGLVAGLWGLVLLVAF